MRECDLRRLTGGVAALVLLVPSGCEREDVRSYTVQKEEVSRSEVMSDAGAARGETVTWTLPDGWREQPGTGLRYATLLIESGDAERPLELRVTPLALMARDPLANVNRWREQLGLAPITADELDTVTKTIEVDGREVHLISLISPPHGGMPAGQILAAILPGDERAWFFMIMDEAKRIEPHAGEFETFMRSVRLSHGTGAMTAAGGGASGDATDTGGMAAGAATPAAEQPPAASWKVPEGWTESEGSSRMRIATLKVERDGRTAEITVTNFPGDVGGTLPNINRWRGQVGLPALADLSEQPMDRIDIDGQPAGLIDLTGPTAPGADPGEAPRMLVAIARRPATTWFFKMTGPAGLVEEEQAAFKRFASSVRFNGEGSD